MRESVEFGRPRRKGDNAVCCGAVLRPGGSQVRFPIRSLHFTIDLILLAAPWPKDRLGHEYKSVPGIFAEVKGGRSVRLTISPPPVTSHNRMGLHGLHLRNSREALKKDQKTREL
jgi:hypothetical protein